MGDHTVQDLDKIQKIMENGNYEEARPLILKYLEEKPNDPLAIRLHGNTYAYTGYLGKAKKIWHDGLKLFPDNVDLIYNYALAHYLQGNLYLARKFWKKALKLSPEDSEIYFNLGQVARDEGSLKKAIYFWIQALKFKKDNVELMNNIGVAYASLNMYGKAALWYKRAVKQDKNYALAHFNLANALFEKGEYAGAKDHAEAAARLDPASHMETVAMLTRKIAEKLDVKK
ncbi:MAG: tetratricopeptide repeat protein [Candidatus Rifleibacteriota bacterium]